MKKSILTFILTIIVIVGVNAQDQAKQDSLTQDSIIMVEALNIFIEFQEQREAYLPTDSLLLARYSASKDSFIHRQQIKMPQGYPAYEENGKIVVEDKYEKKDEMKPFPTSMQDFNNWIMQMRLRYLKE